MDRIPRYGSTRPLASLPGNVRRNREAPPVERRHAPREQEAARVRGAARALFALTLAGLCLVIGTATASTPTREAARSLSSQAAHVIRDALSFARADDQAEPAELTAVVPEATPREARETSPLTPALRARGWNACMTPDPGFRAYKPWGGGLTMGQVLLPKTGGHTEDLGFDVVVHFHGHEAVRKPFVEVSRGTVLVGIDLGLGSGPYEDAFGLEVAWTELRASIDRALVKHAGKGAHVRHLALSSWSAGYGAVQNILRFEPDVDAVILLDSLHAAFFKGPPPKGAAHGIWGKTFEHVSRYAAKAAKGEGRLFLTHSEIVTPTYASTKQVADYFIQDLGMTREVTERETPLGLEMVSEAKRGNVVVRGYGGRDERAHCGHTELLAHILRDELEPSWDDGAPRAPIE